MALARTSPWFLKCVFLGGGMFEGEPCRTLGVDSTIGPFKNRICFPWVFDGFLKRFGSPERMDMEGSPRRTRRKGRGSILVPGPAAPQTAPRPCNICTCFGDELLNHDAMCFGCQTQAQNRCGYTDRRRAGTQLATRL